MNGTSGDAHEEFAQQEVTVCSPNEQLFLTTRGDSDVRVALAPGYYARSSSQDLARDLTRASRLMVVQRTRVMYDALSRESGERVQPGTDRLHSGAREYRDRLDEIVATGEAAEGRMRITCVGLAELTAFVDSGVVTSLSEEQFCAACREGALAMIADQRAQISALKFDLYIRPLMEGTTR